MVFRGLDWTGLVKRRLVKCGLVKRRLVKRGLVKHRLVKRGLVKRGLVKCGLVKRRLVKRRLVLQSVFWYKHIHYIHIHTYNTGQRDCSITRVQCTCTTRTLHAVSTHLARNCPKMRVVTHMQFHTVDVKLRVKLHAVVQRELVKCM